MDQAYLTGVKTIDSPFIQKITFVIRMEIGDVVIEYYDADASVPLILPPRYQAIFMSKLVPGQNVKVACLMNS